MIHLDSTSLLAPRPPVIARDWLPANVSMPAGTETGGLPFSLASFPHVDGVLDAFDNPRIRRIVLQWGTRLGKTTTCLALMAMVGKTNPRNMMFASATERAALRVTGERLWPILESTRDLKLPPPARRSSSCVRLPSCRIYVGYSGSPESLADVGAGYGVGNEIDKWDASVSDEADPLLLFLNRLKGFTDHKAILESTPTIRGRSRVEKLLHESDQHTRQVPCPHCGEYQVLVKGVQNQPGGFWWWHDGDGRSDPEIANETACYICKFCAQKIENHHRTPMLRRGVWCPLQCRVNIYGEIEGTNDLAGSDSIGFGPLPSWYALTETWGAFPRRWLAAQGNPRQLQDVVNSYMAETWEKRTSKNKPHEVGRRLATQVPRGVVPEWGRFLTVTVDQQAADGGFCPWVVMAHGDDEQAHLVDYGWASTLNELWSTEFVRHFQHMDGGPQMQPCAGAIDSSWNTKATYDFVNSHSGLLALKGANTDLGGRPFKIDAITEERSDYQGQLLLRINTDYWETDLQARLDNREPQQAGGLSLCHGAEKDFPFLDQLCNAELADKTDKRGNATQLWVKKHEGIPNDMRDAIRYGLVLAAAYLEENGGQIPPRVETFKKSQMVVNPGDSRPDGRSWL